ncbi:MAG: hypothetical protein U0X20_17295 [Caldilineaceae bacterium]
MGFFVHFVRNEFSTLVRWRQPLEQKEPGSAAAMKDFDALPLPGTPGGREDQDLEDE